MYACFTYVVHTYMNLLKIVPANYRINNSFTNLHFGEYTYICNYYLLFGLPFYILKVLIV